MQFRTRPSGAEAVVLLDMEAALNLNVSIAGKKLIEVKPGSPLSVRYKAVGLRIGNSPDQPRFEFRPVFDASKGYTIDVSKPGAITVASPLDQILTVLGARIARNNPLVFEIDLGFAVDLGVVAIERARVRLKFDPLGAPELTAFAAAVDIPGALRGRGYMELNENEIKGQIDLTIVPVQVRIAAGVGVANIDESGRKTTGVIIALEVEFPVAIPLANSGLGIYGFLGLFAMHYRRKEPAASTMAPALAWLKDVAHGNPMDIAAWAPKIDNWAFGIGAIVGTMGSSVIFNLKGVVLLELPGPRLLLVMKANLLAVLPELKGNAEGTFLAVIDLDMGRGTLTIGISAQFEIKPLLEIRIPVEAFFNFNDGKDWHLYLGRFVDQIHAKIFEVFEGSGYLMLSGKGFVGRRHRQRAAGPVQRLRHLDRAACLHRLGQQERRALCGSGGRLRRGARLRSVPAGWQTVPARHAAPVHHRPERLGRPDGRDRRAARQERKSRASRARSAARSSSSSSTSRAASTSPSAPIRCRGSRRPICSQSLAARQPLAGAGGGHRCRQGDRRRPGRGHQGRGGAARAAAAPRAGGRRPTPARRADDRPARADRRHPARHAGHAADHRRHAVHLPRRAGGANAGDAQCPRRRLGATRRGRLPVHPDKR